MKLKKLMYSSALLAALLAQSTYADQQSISFKNQRGSLLELNILPDNKIEGFFTTAVASKSCPDAIGTKQAIVGYLIGNALTFSVAYPKCGSVLSITGNFDKEMNNLDTLSILNRQSDDITHEGPGARLIGHDSYQKTA